MRRNRRSKDGSQDEIETEDVQNKELLRGIIGDGMEALQEELGESQKMEAMSRLAGGIAHDFNNLLTAIKGYCQLSFVEMKKDDPLRQNIEEIRKTAERGDSLVRQLLAYSQRQIMEMRVLDLNKLLTNLNKMLRRLIRKDIDLVIMPEKNLGRVRVDPGQIKQAIMNLAVNARDGMPDGGKLTIETANVELDEAYARAHLGVTPGRYVMISVSDTGAGMMPENRDRVFEPYFTTREKGRGTGLGLSTVYGIVRQSGGHVRVYSEPGIGTAFKIYLPCVDEPSEKLKARPVGKKLPRGSETILIAEDDEGVRNLAARILENQGYKVLKASDGEEGLSIAGEHKGPIHLLVADVVMPGISGDELAAQMALIRPDMKVLYMSVADAAIVHHGILDKGLNFIQKPFTVEGLVGKVRKVLDK